SGTMTAAKGAIQCVWVGKVVWRNTLVGACDVATRRIDHPRQLVEGNVALPGVGRLVGVAVAPDGAATNRHTASALIADSTRRVRVTEVEHGHRPVTQRVSESGPISSATDGDGRADVVEVLLADPAQGERRVTVD